MEKMWAGRFAKSLDSKADDFNSSIRFDCKMYKQDIIGSIAHAEMLAKQNIITVEDKIHPLRNKSITASFAALQRPKSSALIIKYF